MTFNNKTLRYYYWLTREFVIKHARLISMSFLFSIIFLIATISLAPYLSDVFLNKKTIVGMVGKHDFNSLPDEITSKISNGLVSINEKGEIIPILASTWEQKDNDQTYRFHLRKNLYLSDGSPFTAKTMTYTFKDVEIKVLSDYLIEFKLKNPLAIFPTYLTKPIIRYPLVGVAGLYSVSRYRLKFGYLTELYLAPNKKGMSQLAYRFYDDETKMINAYKLGEITFMQVNKKSIADVFSSWKNTTVKKTVDYTHLLTLFFNLDREIFKEKDLRQAIAMGIDRNALKAFGENTDSPISPTSWAYNPNLKQVMYNPEVAEKIIKKNYEATTSSVLNLNTYYDYLDIANEIYTLLTAVGLKTNLNFISSSQGSDFDMFLAYFKIPEDPDQYFFWHSTQKQANITNYNNKKVDLLLENGRKTLSKDDREKIYFDFQKVLNDDLPAIFLYYPYTYVISRI